MYILHTFFILTFVSGLSRAKDGEPLPAKSYQISCTFEDDNSCSWVKDANASQQFVLSSNVAGINNPPNGCKYLVERGDSNELRSASIQSPEFMTLPSMLLLQVNISFWIQNWNQSARLQLLMLPLEGKANGSQIEVWNTELDAKSSQLWSVATINIKKHEAHRMKLILQGSVSSTEDMIAINQINLTEITESEKIDVGLLPDSFTRLTNESTCQNDAQQLRGNSLCFWVVLLSIFYTLA